jgi:hypothetical protein
MRTVIILFVQNDSVEVGVAKNWSRSLTAAKQEKIQTMNLDLRDWLEGRQHGFLTWCWASVG